MTTTATPTPSATEGAAAPTATPEATEAAAIEAVFGPSDDGAADEGGEAAEEAAVAPDAQQADATQQAATEDGGEAADELDYDALVKVAEERAGKREAKSAHEVRARELETQVAERDARLAALQRDADVTARLRGMAKDDPLALLETMGITGDRLVSFLQNGHKQAINRSGFQQAQTLEQLKAVVEQQQAKISELETGVPQRIEQHAVSQAQMSAQREFVALTEGSEAFPFLAMEPPEARINAAREAHAALVAADHKHISHEIVAKVAESRLRKAFQSKRDLIEGRASTANEADDVVAQEGGGAAGRRSQVNGSARKGAPRTITAQHAASPPDYRSMSEAERDSAAEREIRSLFFAS